MLEIPALDRLIAASPELTEELKENEKHPYLLHVLLHEVVFGPGLKGGGVVGRLRKNSSSYKKQMELWGEKRQEVVIESTYPRYARVNLMLTTVKDLKLLLQSTGYVEFTPSKPSRLFPEYLEAVREKEKDSPPMFAEDPLVAHMMLLPPGMDLHEHPAVVKQWVILQDRASALPALELHLSGALTPGMTVIDACAAPGNKTIQLAEVVTASGSVHACDRDPNRFKTLQRRTLAAGATNIVCHNISFLDIDPEMEPWSQASCILLDPSCSGSGMRQSSNSPPVKDPKRIQSLSSLQLSLLLHAMSFPSAKHIVYSTCSLYEEENEQVVSKVLQQSGGLWELVKAYPEWPMRGLSTFPVGNDCLRASLAATNSIGFFLAHFQRVARV